MLPACTSLLWSGVGAAQAGRLTTPPGHAGHSVLASRSAPSDTAPPDSTKKGKGKRKVDVSGYVQVFYKMRRDANGDGVVEPSVFRDQRVRIEFKGDVTRHAAYDLEVDPRAPEITGVLRDAFIALDYVRHHEIRIGQQKTLFGYENPASSARLFTVNRSEVSDNLSRGPNLRDIGIGLTGWLPAGERWRVEDALTLVNGSGMNVQADSTAKKNLWGRIGLRYKRPDWTVRFGVSGASGDQQEPLDSGPPLVIAYTHGFTRLGADVEVDHPRVFFAAEFVSGNDKAPASLPDAGGGSVGYYAIVAGKTRWNAGPLLRYDALEGFRRWTGGGYVGLPSDDVSLLLNYEVFRDDLGKHDDRFYLRLQLRF
jgi:hypothetical protein